MLRLTLARAGSAPGQEGTSRSFNGPKITIGRSPENDWALPDPERHLSKTHCVIEFAGGRYAVTDTSTNGVFLNRAAEPLGRNNRAPLSDGDRIDVGSYQFEIEIQDGAAAEFDTFGSKLAAEADDDLDPFGVNRPSRPPTASRADSGFAPPRSGSAKSNGPAPVIPDFDDFDDLLEGLEKPPTRRSEPPPGDIFGPAPSRIEEAELFGGRPQQDEWDRSEADHAPSRAEFFRPPDVVSTPIPDDWDDLLPSAPPAKPSPPAAFDELPARQSTPAAKSQPARQPIVEAEGDPEPAVVTRPDPVRTPDPVAAGPAQARPAAPPPEASRPAPARPVPERNEAAQRGASGAAFDAFLAGAGLEANTLRLTEDEAERTMHAAGKAFRHMVEGLRDVLMARSAIKNEFRVERTMIRAADNNPLKFSVSAEEALFALLRPVVKGYLPADRAVEEALTDIKAHQLATMAGMQVAIARLLAQFDPEELKKQLEKHSLLDSILPGSKKARYWEAYEKLYREIARTAEDDFHGSYGREFARAYEEQVRKL